MLVYDLFKYIFILQFNIFVFKTKLEPLSFSLNNKQYILTRRNTYICYLVIKHVSLAITYKK